MLGAPVAKTGVGFGESLVGAEVDGGGDAPRGQLRAMDAVVAGKGCEYLGTDLDRTLGVQIQSDMAAWLWQASGAGECPDFAARCGDKSRKLSGMHAVTHYGRKRHF